MHHAGFSLNCYIVYKRRRCETLVVVKGIKKYSKPRRGDTIRAFVLLRVASTRL